MKEKFKFPEMSLKQHINSSKNALVINLEKATLTDIVEKKLSFLSITAKQTHKNLFQKYYSPVDKAFADFALRKYGGNQFKATEFLGINRNTLKKKINLYKLDIQNILIKTKQKNKDVARLFLSPFEDLDLFSACLAKLHWEHINNTIPKDNLIKNLAPPIEYTIIQKILNKCQKHQAKTLLFLGINRNTLKKKMNIQVTKSQVFV